MNEPSPWQRRLLDRVGLPTERSAWPEPLTTLPADLESASLTLPFSLPLLARAQQGLEAGQRRVVIGLNGPVGAGKSTLARQLLRLAPRFGLRLAVASIDDAYRPLAERRRVLAGNPFGVSRVPPGSHDIPLLLEAIETWREQGTLRLPRFNKSLMAGEGERDGWSESEAEVLVLEGWLIGCRPLAAEDLQLRLTELMAGRSACEAPANRAGSGSNAAGTSWESAISSNPFMDRSWNRSRTSESDGADGMQTTNLEADLGADPGSHNGDQSRLVKSGPGGDKDAWLKLSDAEAGWVPTWNEALEDYVMLWDQLDALWVLRPSTWTLPRRWRLQAEARQRKAGGGWLSAKDLQSLVRASLASLPPQLYQDPLLDATRNGSAEAVAILDGQRRCRWSGLTTDWPLWLAANDQLSSVSASSATG